MQLSGEPGWIVNNSDFKVEWGGCPQIVIKGPWDHKVTEMLLGFGLDTVEEGGKCNEWRQIRVYYIDRIKLFNDWKRYHFWVADSYFIDRKYFTWESRLIIYIKIELICIIYAHIIIEYYVYLERPNIETISGLDKKLVFIRMIFNKFVQKWRIDYYFEVFTFLRIWYVWQKID